MPVAGGPRLRGRSALIVGASGVLVALAIGAVVLLVANRSSSVKVHLGDDQFQDISAPNAAKEIARNGPLLIPDASNGTRDILVQHVGDDPAQGWSAFEARPAGESRNCNLRWDAAPRVLRDNGRCSQSFTFPADGAGLHHYVVRVDKGKVIVDLNADPSATTTTAKGS